MKYDKTAKRTDDVARAREYRIERLKRILRFAYDELTPKQLLEEMKLLQRDTPELSWSTTFPADPIQYEPLVLDARQELRKGLRDLFSSDRYDAVWELPRGRREITPRADGFHSAAKVSLDVGFLNLCADLLCGPEGKRIQRCAEPRCPRLFVKRKKGLYCDVHNLPRLRSKRHRETLKTTVSAEERTLRRYRYYLAQLRRRDPKAWKLRLRELRKNWPERYAAVTGNSPNVTASPV